MKIIESRDGEREAKVLASMIGSPTVLSSVAPKWEDGLFSSPHCNLIASWCIKFHEQHNTAPKKDIIHLFESWRDKSQDEDQAKIVETLLSSLSDKWEEMEESVTPEALVDVAGEHFNRVKLKKLAEAIQGDLDVGKLDKAEERINAHCKVELGAGAGVDVLVDEESVNSTFDQESVEVLVDYPGDLGKLMGRIFHRGAFVVFEGPEKSGKSFNILDVAFRALSSRKRVAYFQVGDMTENEVKQRIMSRVTKHPFLAETIRLPKEIIYDNDDIKTISIEKEFPNNLTAAISWEACQRLMKKTVKSKRSFFRLSCHPNLSIGVDGIRAILDSWERLNWIPEVICIDYSDLLAPPTKIKEYRDQINENWSRLRMLSQERHCLLVTATQVRRDAYGQGKITMSHTADDKRKLSHVTAMIGISSIESEREYDIARLNVVSVRGQRKDDRVVAVAQCLAIAHPTMCSMFVPSRKKKSKQEEEE